MIVLQLAPNEAAFEVPNNVLMPSWWLKAAKFVLEFPVTSWLTQGSRDIYRDIYS